MNIIILFSLVISSIYHSIHIFATFIFVSFFLIPNTPMHTILLTDSTSVLILSYTFIIYSTFQFYHHANTLPSIQILSFFQSYYINIVEFNHCALCIFKCFTFWLLNNSRLINIIINLSFYILSLGLMTSLREELRANPANNIKVTIVHPFFLDSSPINVKHWEVK